MRRTMSEVEGAAGGRGQVTTNRGWASRLRDAHHEKRPSTAAHHRFQQRLGERIRSVLQLWRWAGREALVHPLGGDIPRLIAFRGRDGRAA